MALSDKGLRRKARNKLKRLGLPMLDLEKAQGFADRKFAKLSVLNGDIDNGTVDQRLSAASAKRKMNEVWLKSGRDYCDAPSKPSAGHYETKAWLQANAGAF